MISAILQCSNAGKQVLGQRMALYLGLIPGPRGSDDGIDGELVYQRKKIHFQSKLRSTQLDREDARSYYSDIAFHNANISIILSGIGFKDTFRERLFGHDGIDRISIHLLCLEDVIEQSDNFCAACKQLPALLSLTELVRNGVPDQQA